MPEWATARGRNWLRLGEIARAEAELATVRAAKPGDVVAWALTDLCWRLSGDARHEWLHGQPGWYGNCRYRWTKASAQN